MKRSSTFVAFAAVLATLIAATAALAGESKGNTLYRYVGELTAKASDGSSVTVKVQNGNRPALRSLLDQSTQQKFAIDSDTVILKWEGGKPSKPIRWDDEALAIGDYVTVNVRADREAPLGDILKRAAGIVSDHGKNPVKPDKPLYLFRGTLVSADKDSGKVTIKVKGGNPRALRLMIDQDETQTFLTNGDTVFLHWAKRIPDVIDISGLNSGDRIVIRVRAAGGLDLGSVETTPAKRVADREPKAQEGNQSAQA